VAGRTSWCCTVLIYSITEEAGRPQRNPMREA
jgi:hypothetical protein